MKLYSYAVWKQLKQEDPKSFHDAVSIDQALRNLPATKRTGKGEAFLRRSRTPLVEVDFDGVTSYSKLVLEECEEVYGI